MANVGDSRHAVLIPPIGAGPCVIMWEEGPGIAVGTVVLAYGAPRTLRKVRAPLIPGVGVEQVVLCATGRLGQSQVLCSVASWGVARLGVLRAHVPSSMLMSAGSRYRGLLPP